MDFFKIPEQVKVCSPDVQNCDSTVRSFPFSQDPEFHHLMVTAAKAAPKPLHSSQVVFCLEVSYPAEHLPCMRNHDYIHPLQYSSCVSSPTTYLIPAISVLHLRADL